MPGGVPHWVLTTSNAICVGRHFYGKSTIRSSVISNVHTFLFGGSLTNQHLTETRSLFCQLLVFWSTRIDKTDVDGGFDLQTEHPISNLINVVGGHIPDLSSVVEFFDVLYLGVFVILSSAFDGRVYRGSEPPLRHLKEIAHAVFHFQSLLHIFSRQFIIVLEGEAVAHSYVVDRMLAEFAAASAALAIAVRPPDVIAHSDDDDVGVSSSEFRNQIEDILLKSHTDIIPYFSRCLGRGHKDFMWTGPKVQILPRSDDFASLISHATMGEMLDLPSHSIYTEDLDAAPPTPLGTITQIGKRRARGSSLNLEDQQARKRIRRS